MSIRLSEDEAWQFLAAGHTGIFTTLRRDGMPITLPVWFAVLDRKIYVAGAAKTKKFARIRNDARCAFLVESGTRWAELKAVQVNGRARIIEDDAALQDRVQAALDAKYAPFRTVRAAMPQQAQTHYAARAFAEITADPRILSWDNARIALAAPARDAS